MPTMEAPSTEKRIDDLNDRMAEGFGQVHREIDGLNLRLTERFQRVEKEMSEGFKRVDREIARVDGDIRELRGDIKELSRETSVRFDAMHRTMMRGFFALGGITVTLFVALAGLQGF
ncbi:MAG TPA: hypothetical protein VFJ65_05165 [Solirubrobacterales bacterium]|nr:hypothetical protein [Solirubrobacterales bacterium]